MGLWGVWKEAFSRLAFGPLIPTLWWKEDFRMKTSDVLDLTDRP